MAPRLREVARAREVVVDFFDGKNEDQSTAANLQKYFDAFCPRRQALRARTPVITETKSNAEFLAATAADGEPRALRAGTA